MATNVYKPGMEQLQFLIGHWQTQGEIRPADTMPPATIKGTDSYEWILDGYFILHKVNVMMGDERTEVIEIIGEYDAEKKTYQMRSFDNQGNFMTMQAEIDENNVLQIVANNMRSRLSKGADGNTMTAHWEQLQDNDTWTPWMDLNFSK